MDGEARIGSCHMPEPAAGVAAAVLVHDLNNLLNIVLAASEALALQAAPGSDAHELARITQSAAERSGVLVQRLAQLSDGGSSAPGATDCAEALVTTARLANVATPAAVTVLARAMPAPLACRADRADLESALLNLCVNAAHAMPSGGAIQLSAQAEVLSPQVAEALSLRPGSYAAVAVRDPGTGMSADVLARATEPRFSTRKARDGSGLGLTGVAAFARRNGGALDLISAPDQGTTATLYLPVA
ncbi:ATP-binding protein [Phenylobacterium sp.]|uniref:sensor histidine kinase n=1 Tax=Phenylobacterium sp. TaxID=1871053 RepID=UPI00301D0F66